MSMPGHLNDSALNDLLEHAKKVVMTEEEKEEQRRSFAYGNTSIENPRITREMVDREADLLAGMAVRPLTGPRG